MHLRCSSLQSHLATSTSSSPLPPLQVRRHAAGFVQAELKLKCSRVPDDGELSTSMFARGFGTGALPEPHGGGGGGGGDVAVTHTTEAPFALPFAAGALLACSRDWVVGVGVEV